MVREKFSILAILRLGFAMLVAALSAPASMAVEYGQRAFAYFRPDATTSLALDAFARPLAAEPIPRSRFRAFVARALSHPAFNGGAFAHAERMPA